MKDSVKVIGDPNKPNIRYAVVDTDTSDLYGPFGHIINDIRENNINTLSRYLNPQNYLQFAVSLFFSQHHYHNRCYSPHLDPPWQHVDL